MPKALPWFPALSNMVPPDIKGKDDLVREKQWTYN